MIQYKSTRIKRLQIFIRNFTDEIEKILAATNICINGLNMERYFTYLFSMLPFTGKITDNLLPWSDKMIEKFHV